jgi:propionyl-CoA synthetase
VGHSYIVYGPLIAGMATIMYEGMPICPDPGIWWSIVEKYKVTRMFSAPTAIRVLRKPPELCASTICPRCGAVSGRRAAR